MMTGLFMKASAQVPSSEPVQMYLIHSSGNHLVMASDNVARLESPTASNKRPLLFIPDGKGYFSIQANSSTPLFLSLSGSWNTAFIADSASDNAKYAIEQASSKLYRLRCKANNRYLGTDANTPNSTVFCDKSGDDARHIWYFSKKADTPLPADTTAVYPVCPSVVRQHFDGWGVSLCWWANMCGHWNDESIDKMINWLVSPTGLNYRIFRYNIGGGDDPQNIHCDAHHMGHGKGRRAEMEGFKDSSDDVYHWERDEAQRKIMLKIREKRPDAIFEAFSNSCPYYMTYSGCVSGNTSGGKDNLRPEYYEEFAHYLVDVCKHYKDEYGIEFRTLEPFNEPVTNFWYANGVQEGCHFDASSQSKFIKILSPILKESGLNTIISASDETNVGQSINTFNRYLSDGVMPLVGQWNTHTYGGTNPERARLNFLAWQSSIPLWMSEVGEGGQGLSGNLSLTQKLFDDMRYLQPSAWIDWQYMEENSDTWCTIRGSFAQQTFARVKNFYVREQCSRFIPAGYDIITSLNNQSLAAVSPQRDTLVLVILNQTVGTVTHRIDLSLFDYVADKSLIQTYRTSSSESIARFSDFEIDDRLLTITMPSQSIATLVIPVTTTDKDIQTLISEASADDGRQYLIVPRHEQTRAVTASDNGKVVINDLNVNDQAQRWSLIPQSDGSFIIQNERGQRLTGHRSSNSSSLTAETDAKSEQSFLVESVDPVHFRILSAYQKSQALDLVREETKTGTAVDLWQYSSGGIPTHRQWMLIPLPGRTDLGVRNIEVEKGKSIKDLTDDQHLTVYDCQGKKCFEGSPSQFNHARSALPAGVYIIRIKGETRKVVL